MKKGVSIVICCYNSAGVLPQTLLHISRMKVDPAISWEVIIVDNNSNDKTSEIAGKLMNEYKKNVHSKILFHPVQGLSSARKVGFDNSEYEYIIFCDDDNRLNDDYVELSFRIMEENEKIGVLGGDSEAVTDGEFPEWFSRYQNNYSVGRQAESGGDITWSHGALWGAGMVIRKTALNELFSKGYKSFLSDRTKYHLTSGGDVELCYALRLAGWKIWYDPALTLEHYIPGERLNWNYLRKLNRGFGAQKVDFDAYLKAFEPEPKSFSQSIKEKWQYQSVKLIQKFRGYGIRKLLKFNSSFEGDPEILRIEKTIGRLKELLKIRGEYRKRIKSVRNAPWRKVFSYGKI